MRSARNPAYRRAILQQCNRGCRLRGLGQRMARAFLGQIRAGSFSASTATRSQPGFELKCFQGMGPCGYTFANLGFGNGVADTNVHGVIFEAKDSERCSNVCLHIALNDIRMRTIIN